MAFAEGIQRFWKTPVSEPWLAPGPMFSICEEVGVLAPRMSTMVTPAKYLDPRLLAPTLSAEKGCSLVV